MQKTKIKLSLNSYTFTWMIFKSHLSERRKIIKKIIYIFCHVTLTKPVYTYLLISSRSNLSKRLLSSYFLIAYMVSGQLLIRFLDRLCFSNFSLTFYCWYSSISIEEMSFIFWISVNPNIYTYFEVLLPSLSNLKFPIVSLGWYLSILETRFVAWL